MKNKLSRAVQYWSALMLLAGLPWSAQAAPVYLDTVTNLEWRQVKDTVGFSYNQMNTDTNGTPAHGCSASTGVCSGNLGVTGPSVDGWRWATELEVRTLFHDFSGALNIPGFDPLPGSPSSYAELSSSWAPALIDIDGVGVDLGIFEATRIEIDTFGQLGVSVIGRTRTPSPFMSVYSAVLFDYMAVSQQFDIALTSAPGSPTALLDVAVGFWLVRGEAADTALPVPATVLLLATGVAVLGWRRRASAISSIGNGPQQS